MRWPERRRTLNSPKGSFRSRGIEASAPHRRASDLRDLKLDPGGDVGRNNKRARNPPLSKLVRWVVARYHADRMMAEVTGDLKRRWTGTRVSKMLVPGARLTLRQAGSSSHDGQRGASGGAGDDDPVVRRGRRAGDSLHRAETDGDAAAETPGGQTG
jgi:hypothetical protein